MLPGDGVLERFFDDKKKEKNSNFSQKNPTLLVTEQKNTTSEQKIFGYNDYIVHTSYNSRTVQIDIVR